jgi:hypothetical protein
LLNVILPDRMMNALLTDSTNTGLFEQFDRKFAAEGLMIDQENAEAPY